MPDTTIDAPRATLTFGLPAELKAEFAAIAEKEARPVEELLRDLIRERVKQERRREFEAEARRQCLAANAAAQDPNSDAAAVTRELDAHLDSLADEWKWE
jgi:hypothetical protein